MTTPSAHQRITQRQRQRARGGRYLIAQIVDARALKCHELSTANYSPAFLFALFKAGREKGLSVRLEGDSSGITFSCTCSDVDFASLKMAAYQEAGK